MNYDELTVERVESILEALDIPYEDKGRHLIMPTYCHHHKNEECSKKLYFYKDSKLFNCFSNCETMNIISFLKNYYDAQDYSYDWYNDIINLIDGRTKRAAEGFEPRKISLLNGFEKLERPTPQLVYNEKILGAFVKRYTPEWLNDGITKETMDKYNILYSISQNKIIIPHYNINGELIGIRGRALDPEEAENGKYRPVKIEKTQYSFHTSLNLYGLNITKENVKKYGLALIAEGEKSVLQLESFDFPNCCSAICGSSFNFNQVRILLENCNPREICLCLDQEEQPGKDVSFNKLWKMMNKYKAYCRVSFIYDRDRILKLKESPFDRGSDVFKELFKRRIMIN